MRLQHDYNADQINESFNNQPLGFFYMKQKHPCFTRHQTILRPIAM